jgi:LacI family transcriptional regulator
LADDPDGTRQALDHLYELGHRRIAYANVDPSYFDHYSVAERHDALLSWMRDRGLTPVPGHDQRFVDQDHDAAAFLRASVLEHGATAVLAYDHVIAVRLLGAAFALNLAVPRDFSLACFNDEFPVAMLAPPVTAVAVDGKEMGRVAAEQLLKALGKRPDGARGPTSPPASPGEFRVGERLVIRASTAPPRSP